GLIECFLIVTSLSGLTLAYGGLAASEEVIGSGRGNPPTAGAPESSAGPLRLTDRRVLHDPSPAGTARDRIAGPPVPCLHGQASGRSGQAGRAERGRTARRPGSRDRPAVQDQ